MPGNDFEDYKKYVKDKLQALTPIFAKAAIGDFSSKVSIPEEDDEFTQLYVGIDIILEVINEKIKELSSINDQIALQVVQTDEERIRVEAILESIGEGLIATDEKGAILFFNKPAESMLWLTSEEVNGKLLVEVVPMHDEQGNLISKDSRPMTRALATKGKISGTFYYSREDGSRFPVALTVTPIILNNKIIGSIEVFRDVSREKELDKLKDEFISLASHELRTPMTAIKGFLAMITNGDYGPVNEGLKRPLHNVALSADRQIDLINDLLDVSRIQSGAIQYTLSSFPFSKVIQDSITQMQPLISQKGIHIENSSSEEIVIQADYEKFKQIIDNIVINALKFTVSGSIKFTYQRKDDLAVVYISDTGTGIEPQDQSKLFRKFEQINSNLPTKPFGSGLGLYISREFARKMGGDIWLESSELGKGSTFAVGIPLANSNLAISIQAQLENENVKMHH